MLEVQHVATYRRAIAPGGCFFFTVNTHQRQKLLLEPEVLAALSAAIRAVRAERPFMVEAIVVLPDHLHTIWTLPEGDADYAMRWNLIKRRTSLVVRDHVTAVPDESRRKRREIGLWQRRYWEHQIRDDRDFARHVEYIHWNPVKHGYVQRVADWPHSSFHRFVREQRFPADWATGDLDGSFGEPG